jgi:hypothetical protein
MQIFARRLFAGALLAGIALSLIACHSTYYDFCKQRQECEGGNDKDIDACIESQRGEEDIAGDYDCKDSFSKYKDCYTVKGSCKNGAYDFVSPCSNESKAYSSCKQAASGRGK